MKSPLPIFVLAALALGPELLAQTGATGPTPVGGRGNHPSFSAEVTGYIAGARVNLTLIVSSEYNPFQVDIFDNPNATGTPRATMTAAVSSRRTRANCAARRRRNRRVRGRAG